MLTKRCVKQTTHVLWRGAFLRYCTLQDEPDDADYRDQWACLRVEQQGLSPTVRPGKALYNKLRTADFQTFQRLNDMAKRKLLVWTPPINGSQYLVDNEMIAIVLNGLSEDGDPHVTAEDASLRLAAHTEAMELRAEQCGHELIRCEIDPSTLIQMMDGVQENNPTLRREEILQRCLELYYLVVKHGLAPAAIDMLAGKPLTPANIQWALSTQEAA